MKLALFLAALPLCSQTVSFSPYDKVGSNVAWSVTACLSPGSAGTVLPGGKLYQMMALRGLNPVPYAKAIEIVHAQPGRSAPARIIKYAGWLAVAGGFLVQTQVVRANPKIQVGLQLGGSFLSVLVPIVRREVPGPTLVEAQLIGPFLQISASGCASGAILGGLGSGFQVTM